MVSVVRYQVTLGVNNCVLLIAVESAELEPADLQWSGQKFELDYNLMMFYGIISLPILWTLEINTILYNYIAS